MKSPGCATPIRCCWRAEPPPSGLWGQDDLAERAAIEVIQRLRQLVEAVYLIDHRLQVDGLHGAHQIFQHAATAGFGIAWLPCWLVREQLLSGTWVRLLRDRPGTAFEAHAVWPQAPHLRLAVDTLVSKLPASLALVEKAL